MDATWVVTLICRALAWVTVALWLAGPVPGARAVDPARALTAEQKRSTLATSAILFERHRARHEVLGGGPGAGR